MYSIVKFIAHKVQHDVACIDVMVVQVHNSMNKKYELYVVNKTRPKDIKNLSL
jgi:hypothetical protein